MRDSGFCRRIGEGKALNGAQLWWSDAFCYDCCVPSQRQAWC